MQEGRQALLLWQWEQIELRDSKNIRIANEVRGEQTFVCACVRAWWHIMLWKGLAYDQVLKGPPRVEIGPLRSWKKKQFARKWNPIQMFAAKKEMTNDTRKFLS